MELQVAIAGRRARGGERPLAPRGAAIAPAGEHALSAWVQRRDDVGLSARRNGLRVELAEVVR